MTLSINTKPVVSNVSVSAAGTGPGKSERQGARQCGWKVYGRTEIDEKTDRQIAESRLPWMVSTVMYLHCDRCVGEWRDDLIPLLDNLNENEPSNGSLQNLWREREWITAESQSKSKSRARRVSSLDLHVFIAIMPLLQLTLCRFPTWASE